MRIRHTVCNQDLTIASGVGDDVGVTVGGTITSAPAKQVQYAIIHAKPQWASMLHHSVRAKRNLAAVDRNVRKIGGAVDLPVQRCIRCSSSTSRRWIV